MKRVLGVQILVGIFLLSFIGLSNAAGKWGSLNLLKNVSSGKVDDGFIIRLEFEELVDEFREPVFFEKSIQIDFPLSYIKPAKKYFPADSFATSRVFAAQFKPDTLRIRFLKKDSSVDMGDRFHLVRQGRFLIIRIDEPETLFKAESAATVKKWSAPDDKLMSEDELASFLEKASAKIRVREIERVKELKKIENKSTESGKVEKAFEVKVTRAGMGVEPIVNQIKKAALKNAPDDKEPETRNTINDRSEAKENRGFSLKDSRPTGKPVELIPSGLKMLSMLAIVIGVMFLLFFGFKKYVLKNTMFGGGQKLVNVLGSGFLAPKKNIVLVEVAGEVLVLGTSNDQITLLTNITDPEKIEEIKSVGSKGGSGLNWNMENYQQVKATSSAKKPAGQFSNYLKQFSGSEKSGKDKSLADVTAQIRRQMGKYNSARA